MKEAINMSADNGFAVGDVVRPKGGGPRMTVEAIGDKLSVIWFICSGESWYGPHRATLDAEMLERCASPNVEP